MNLPDLHDTIGALATVPGESSIAVIRVSGERAFAVADAVCDRAVSGLKRSRWVVNRTIVTADGETIDHAIAIGYRAPHSYTGQDVVEFSVHGSPIIVEKLLASLLAAGVRMATAGEFTLRAFWNGKLTLDQAEGVAALIAAHDDGERAAALQLLDGELAKFVRMVRERLEEVALKLELSLDFSDDEVPLFEYQALLETVRDMRNEMAQVIALHRQTQGAQGLLTIAIAGPANAGKSSLLNRLLARERAIVSNIAGTTRDWVEGELRIAGRRIRLIDTAGLRSSRGKIEAEGVRRSEQLRADADLTLFVVAANPATFTHDRWWKHRSNATLMVINKVDLLSNTAAVKYHADAVAKLVSAGWNASEASDCTFMISAKNGDGIDSLRTALEQWVTSRSGSGRAVAAIPLNQRHGEIFQRVITTLQSIEQLFSSDSAPEIVAEEVRSANQALGEIVGEHSPDDLLGKIFSGFCIGK